MNSKSLLENLNGLVVFRNILSDPVVEAFEQSLRSITGSSSNLDAISSLADFESKLFAERTNWSEYLLDVVLQDENPYVHEYVKCARTGGDRNPVIDKCANSELEFLNTLGQVGLEDFIGFVPMVQKSSFAFLPRWETSSIDFVCEYSTRMQNIERTGYGMFAKYHVFTIADKRIVPVKHPDSQTLEELPGYEEERRKIIENTEALVNRLPANNILLYGDAGTGKSSAIKAIANKFAPDGLRLVEVKKNQLYELPEIMDSLASNPLKFVIFIDDLSFTSNDDDFAALKAILEGSVHGKIDNVAVYATSNRRHLIKESMEDRTGDDIHEADTRQELMSLSARFGLVITFQSPDKKRFANILNALADQAGLDGDRDELLVRAEAFAIRAGGRSPRVARQFIDLLQAGVEV